jgi:hypothetical protein
MTGIKRRKTEAALAGPRALRARAAGAGPCVERKTAASAASSGSRGRRRKGPGDIRRSSSGDAASLLRASGALRRTSVFRGGEKRPRSLAVHAGAMRRR